MSLVELREVKEAGGAVSGGAMDRVIERKQIDKRILIGAGAGAILLLVLFFWLFAPRAGSQTVNPSRLTISSVELGVFEDFLPPRARATATRCCWPPDSWVGRCLARCAMPTLSSTRSTRDLRSPEGILW